MHILVPVCTTGRRALIATQQVKMAERDRALHKKLERIHKEALAVKGGCLLRTLQGQRL